MGVRKTKTKQNREVVILRSFSWRGRSFPSMSLRKQILHITTWTQTSLVRSSALSCSLPWTSTSNWPHLFLAPPIPSVCCVQRGPACPLPRPGSLPRPPVLSDEGMASLQRPWVSMDLVPLLAQCLCSTLGPLPPCPPAIWAIFQFISCAQSFPTHGGWVLCLGLR